MKVNNCAVTTVEGIGAKKGDLQAIQNEMINTDGSQCGFCTPGMIMTMYTVIRNYKKVTNKQLHQALQGNLCRCTGYRPIWQAFKNTKERFKFILIVISVKLALVANWHELQELEKIKL